MQPPAGKHWFTGTGNVYLQGEAMGLQALLVELLLSGFFAVACFKARAESPDLKGLAPQKLFTLTDRLERLRRSRWQWCAMVMLLIVVRLQQGTPLMAELTVLAQFLLFLALPSQHSSKLAFAQKPVRAALGRR
jgi:hypothetical protein